MKCLAVIAFNVVFYFLLVVFTLVAVLGFTLFLVVLAPFVPQRTVQRRLRRCIAWYGWVVIRVLPFPFIRIRTRLSPARIFSSATTGHPPIRS